MSTPDKSNPDEPVSSKKVPSTTAPSNSEPSATAPRKPAPQYGEYASEAELASAIKRSGGTPTATEVTVQHPVPPAAATLPQTAHPKNAADQIVTVFLLAFGFVYVIGGISTYLNLGDTLQESMKRFGMGNYEPTSQTAAIGIAMLVSQAVCWLVAAAWSYRRVSRRKSSWWVPVVLGVISFLLLTFLLGSLLAADPSFLPKVS